MKKIKVMILMVIIILGVLVFVLMSVLVVDGGEY